MQAVRRIDEVQEQKKYETAIRYMPLERSILVRTHSWLTHPKPGYLLLSATRPFPRTLLRHLLRQLDQIRRALLVIIHLLDQ